MAKKQKDDQEKSRADYLTQSADIQFASKMSTGNIQVDLKSQMSKTHQSSAWIRNKSLNEHLRILNEQDFAEKASKVEEKMQRGFGNSLIRKHEAI